MITINSSNFKCHENSLNTFAVSHIIFTHVIKADLFLRLEFQVVRVSREKTFINYLHSRFFIHSYIFHDSVKVVAFEFDKSFIKKFVHRECSL